MLVGDIVIVGVVVGFSLVGDIDIVGAVVGICVLVSTGKQPERAIIESRKVKTRALINGLFRLIDFMTNSAVENNTF
ncbi:MAG: hypothetical protein ACTSO6_08210 [Promethearchaeota archaeon]